MTSPPLDRVKALLAALPEDDQRELRRYLSDILVTPDEAEAIQVASLQARRPGGASITYTFRQERVRCGKTACWCTEGVGHGPYTYKYWKEDGRLRKEYLGKAGATTRRRAGSSAARARDNSAASSSGPAPPA